MERQIVRGTKQAFVLFVRGRTTSAGGAGEQATNKGIVGFFFRLLSSCSSIRPRVLSSSDVQHVCSSKPHCLFVGKES